MSSLYSCQFLIDGVAAGQPIDLVHAQTDSDALLIGRALAVARTNHTGYEIRKGERLVYRHQGPNLPATVVV
ncbi:MAG: hypothetical protein AB7V53_06925 [Dongiaceae bacterium]